MRSIFEAWDVPEIFLDSLIKSPPPPTAVVEIVKWHLVGRMSVLYFLNIFFYWPKEEFFKFVFLIDYGVCKLLPKYFLDNILIFRRVIFLIYRPHRQLKKNARFARIFSSRASLAKMSAPRARDLMVVALRAPTYVNFALRAKCYALHSV